ncbi:MAG: hybrid sensor histidine kinase/response regulator [Bacteroidales bacterium]|nr:hybrid sensor histidine kinase/response regulator [Bacteroidales bacterium]MCF8388748.1 hybrid sensor histidine kinase/response regulator [Bacteroidales bacterium]MCF8399329.1 hybrid sensor histidine kinase/response regulator [Bacteroidales bacterium]
MNRPVILCVDDETIITDALKDQLQHSFGEEFEIETSDSGGDALELFEELLQDNREVPVVIADYIMPGIKGDELLISIHNKDSITRNILLTGQANLEGITNAVNKADLYRFIQKPWDLDDLTLTIKEAARSYFQQKTIQKQNKELSELNKSLEKKVGERTYELQELNNTKDKFFSIIAHDLKNPFNALLGFSQHLVEEYENTSGEEIKEMLYAMKEASENAYKLLQNLLEWSRSQTGRISWNPGKLFMESLISENIDILKKAAINKNIKFEVDLPDVLIAYADENMVKTIIRNLLSNAIKYSYEGGKITVSGKVDSNYIRICIADQGVGIDEEGKKKLFRIDSDYSTTGTANEEGTGLGLILCKEFVEKNKGEIWVESEKGKGSKFCFTLPEKKVQ